MSQARQRLAQLGIHVPEILLPKKGIQLNQWAVVACDQFTSEQDYWEECRINVGDQPSTLNLILPECYLGQVDAEEETKKIQQKMKDYLKDELESKGRGLVFIDRSTPWVPSRKGLVLALDLDSYEFTPGSKTPIRPTEATVVDRLPARIAVRKEAVLDLPHILVLVNDRQNKIAEVAEKQDAKELYDFELMKDGGHIKGRLIESEDALNALADAFEQVDSENPFLFAIGDGNHSLASAKEIWREMKAQGITEHPARYALVEVENIYDPGLIFEPIHRILFETDVKQLKSDFEKQLSLQPEKVASLEAMKEKVEAPGSRTIGYYQGDEFLCYTLPPSDEKLSAEIFHDFLDPWLENHACKELDYIHGDEAFLELSKPEGNAGFYLSALEKDRFFDLVDQKGSLPRKTFSIGEAQEKRYYLESRRIDR